MAIGHLYVTRNTQNGREYVGQSQHMDQKSRQTYLGSGDYLAAAIRELGRKNLTKTIVAEFDDKVELDYAEILLIAQKRAQGIQLYNGGLGGPRNDKPLLLEMLVRHGVHPGFTQEWYEAIREHADVVKHVLKESIENESADEFYEIFEIQLRMTQDLRTDCPYCGSQVGEICRTDTLKPAKNHAGRRRRLEALASDSPV